MTDLYAFLLRHYRPNRFEERNTWPGFGDYTRRITANYQAELERAGVAVIPTHESATGRAIHFTAGLEILPEREPVKRRVKRVPEFRLTHLLGG